MTSEVVVEPIDEVGEFNDQVYSNLMIYGHFRPSGSIGW